MNNLVNKALEKLLEPGPVAAFGASMMVLIGYVLCVKYPTLKDIFNSYCVGLASVLAVFAGHTFVTNWTGKAGEILKSDDK